MAFLFYTISFVFLLFATVAYFTRDTWKPYAPPIPYITAPGPIPDSLYNTTTRISDFIHSFRYTRLPSTMNWADDAEAGLHSTNFNLAENIEASDSRTGLDARAKGEVHRLMKIRGVGFDEARRLVMEQKFGKEGIGMDGRPMDSKAVMFDR